MISDKDVKKLLKTYKECKQWLENNAPDNVAESYRILFCLVEMQSQVIEKLKGTHDIQDKDLLNRIKDMLNDIESFE
jgi:hypothetical protein